MRTEVPFFKSVGMKYDKTERVYAQRCQPERANEKKIHLYHSIIQRTIDSTSESPPAVNATDMQLHAATAGQEVFQT